MGAGNPLTPALPIAHRCARCSVECAGDSSAATAEPWQSEGKPMSLRSIKQLTVTFGMVSLPVNLHAATEEKDVTFRSVHLHDDGIHGRIKMPTVCDCGQTVSRPDLAKGYEHADGLVILTADDLAGLVTSSREVAVSSFVPADAIDPLMRERTYYLSPDKNRRQDVRRDA